MVIRNYATLSPGDVSPPFDTLLCSLCGFTNHRWQLCVPEDDGMLATTPGLETSFAILSLDSSVNVTAQSRPWP